MALPVERLNERFEGEFKFKGRTLKVPFTLPGDLVQFQLKFRGPKHERFRVVKIERAESYPPELRLETPFCPYHGRCGGCRAQHLEYNPTQLQIKAVPIQEQMEAVCGRRPKLIPAPEIQSYRHRMDFVVDGEHVGLRPIGDFSSFVDIESCGIQRPGANAALALCRELLHEFPGAAYRREDRSGCLKYVTIRQGFESGVIVLTAQEEGRGLRDYADFVAKLTDRLVLERDRKDSPIFGYSLIETSADTHENEVSCGPGGRVIVGRGGYDELIGGQRFDVPYDAFFQPNPPAFDGLLARAFEWIAAHDVLAALNGDGRMLDLYAGAGVLSAVTAAQFPQAFGSVRGFEFTESAVERAPVNFQSVGFSGETDFRAADLNQPSEDLLQDADLLIADPPRAGLSGKLCAAIAERRPAPWFLYISCNPKSQLRDLEVLLDQYEVVEACVVDCYPHTPHLEQAVLLRRR